MTVHVPPTSDRLVAGRGRPPLAEALAVLEREGRPVRVGLVGAGQMGTDLMVQIDQMPGLTVTAVATRTPDRVTEAAAMTSRAADISRVSTVTEITNAVKAGRIAATDDLAIVCHSPDVDVIIDATGNPDAGAMVALATIAAKKHIVMMNAEADVTAGAYLSAEADKAGVVYTLGAGDEPVAAMELIRFVQALGYPVVAAGKGKNNAFNIDAIPDDYRAEAIRRNMNPRMLVEFVDGSKTAVEMSIIANACGFTPDVPGMHGPAAPRDELQKYFCPKEEGGLLSRKGVVDYSVAKGVAPGVFCVAEMRHPRVRERMNDLHLGPGPYYSFFRPYHLTSLEVPLSAACAVLYHESHMRPLPRPAAEVGAMAKRNLKPGEVLDAIGEYSYRGYALAMTDAKARNALPLGLAQGSKVIRPVAKGTLIRWGDVEPDPASHILAARRAQDVMVG
jgi:predicted homoserine dehydrogenase-like protein